MVWGGNDNLPAGVSVWDLPGNRPIDGAYEMAIRIVEEIWRDDGLVKCEDCELRHNMGCMRSERFYDGNCPIVENEAVTMAFEILERRR